MADCGATGSALDRAARVLGGGNNAGGGLASLLVVTTTANPALSFANGHLPPAAPPEYLPQLPNNRFQEAQTSRLVTTTTTPAAEQQQQRLLQSTAVPFWSTPATTISMQHQQVHHPPAAAMMMMQQQHYQQHHQQQQQQQQQQQHMMMMTVQQQQQHAMMGAMLQQQLQMKRQRELQQLHHHNGVAEVGVEGSARPVSIAELSQAWGDVVKTEEELAKNLGGGAKPASIEELSAAWWEANAMGDLPAADVAKELDDYYNDNNMFLDGWDRPSSEQQYEFQNKPLSNPQNEPIHDWLAEGMRHLTDGDVGAAIHALEMELQLHDVDNALAWFLLGQSHAEQDMDHLAILCLERSVETDPYHVPSRLALGVSYVNELEQDKALEQLKAWVTHHPQLSAIASTNGSNSVLPVDDIYGDGTSAASPFDEVQRLLLDALEHVRSTSGREDHHQNNTLADIYTALGVVYNVSRDYDAATDAFRTALSYRPDDYQLYNKLGATMANHDASAMALEQYERARQLKPRYARAWLNTAIAHANLHQYVDAARCYIETLTINPAATHCWSYLRVAVNCAERDDLVPLVMERNVAALRSALGMVP
jgi:peroxin-5